MYNYIISGYYFTNDERKYFHNKLTSNTLMDNNDVIKFIIGKHALNESLNGNTFKLDTIYCDYLK